MKYFSYSAEEGFELHETAEEAKKSAEDMLGFDRAEARSDGWGDYVDDTCWGEVRQQVVETMRRPATDEDGLGAPYDIILDYDLVDVV